MRRRDVRLSSWSVDFDRDPVRDPPRPLSLRHEDYEDKFDFTTVFYDCFWDAAGETIILLGPPLLNLETDLDLAIIACPSMARCPLTVRHLFLGCQVVVRPPAGTTGLIMRTDRSESFVAPQPNLCELFRGRRAVTTLSRDNELVWIRDWVVFNKKYHGCDGVLIYDNNSDIYSINDIYDYLEPVAEDIQIVLVSWPFKYGVPDWRLPLSYEITDSLYCQTGMLEHARRRFLSHARSVLNTDIDELVITERGSSVFAMVEDSATGLLVFDGVWVENYPPPPQAATARPPRHRDFAHVRAADQVGCQTKWAVDPSRVPDAAQWHVHRIPGMAPSDAQGVAEMRHFRAINTDWTVDRNRSRDRRTSGDEVDPRRLRLDAGLQGALANVFPEEGPGPAPTAPPPRPARSAYGWRVHGGRLASERRWREAVEAVQAAASLLPGHPGFRLFLATLHERGQDPGAARALRAQAEALRLRDPWYHLQRGRWLHDEGDLPAARACFARAIEIDPRFTPAYHELARSRLHGGRPDEAGRILEACARRVPDDALARGLLAEGLERRGRLHDALAHVEAAVASDPKNPHFHRLHARVLRRLGRLDAAERAARRGMALDDLPARMQAFGRESVGRGWREYQWRAPIAPELHAELAEILMAKGDPAAAEAAARRALSLARTEPDRHHRLGEILAARGRHGEAAERREAAIALARREMGRPTLRDWPLTYRNRHWERRADRLGRLLSAAGRRDEAIAVLREALATLPDSGLIAANLAALLAAGGDGGAAAALLRSAVLRNPEDAGLHHALSRAHGAADPRRAIESARAAVELEPDNPAFQDNLVALLIAAERFDEAALALDAALPLNRHHGPLHFHLSRLLQRRRRTAEALAAARRAVELDPRRAWWRDHLAALLAEAGRPDEAEAALREALARGVESAGLHLRLSRLLQRKRRTGGALAAARRAVELDPDKPYVHEHLAALLADAGKDDEAEAALRRALGRGVENGGLRFHLSRLLQRRRRTAEAVIAARRAVELDPLRARWRDHLAALLAEAGRPDEAEAALREALARGVESAGLHLRLSRLLQRKRRTGEALAAARRAIELDPDKPYLHEHLAALLADAGGAAGAAGRAPAAAPSEAGPTARAGQRHRLPKGPEGHRPARCSAAG